MENGKKAFTMTGLTRLTLVCHASNFQRDIFSIQSGLLMPLPLVSIFHARLPQKVHFTKQPTKTRQEMSSDTAATSVTSAMRSALSPANLSEAGAFAKERTAEFQRNLHDGSWSLRFLALLGALSMMTIAVLGFLHDVRE